VILKLNSPFVQDTQQETWLLAMKGVLHCRGTAQNAIRFWSVSGFLVFHPVASM